MEYKLKINAWIMIHRRCLGGLDRRWRDLWLPRSSRRRSLDDDLNMRRLTGREGRKEDRRTDVKKWARKRRIAPHRVAKPAYYNKVNHLIIRQFTFA